MEEAGEEPAFAVNSPSQRDLEALQGRWEQVSLEIDGVTNPPDDLSPPGGVTAFHGNRFTVHAVDGQLLLEGTFILDASASPKRVDWMDAIGPDAGKPLAAIYLLEGDRFVFVAADAGAPRPAEFRAGPGQIMRAFVRR
ncbi:MAG TPA: TIGR03067 domain-containing protein [Rhizomicrobium sp.]|nr:TIGR03067 domain-containing protein [Rhizomicrobium sp.]